MLHTSVPTWRKRSAGRNIPVSRGEKRERGRREGGGGGGEKGDFFFNAARQQQCAPCSRSKLTNSLRRDIIQLCSDLEKKRGELTVVNRRFNTSIHLFLSFLLSASRQYFPSEYGVLKTNWYPPPSSSSATCHPAVAEPRGIFSRGNAAIPSLKAYRLRLSTVNQRFCEEERLSLLLDSIPSMQISQSALVENYSQRREKENTKKK